MKSSRSKLLHPWPVSRCSATRSVPQLPCSPSGSWSSSVTGPTRCRRIWTRSRRMCRRCCRARTLRHRVRRPVRPRRPGRPQWGRRGHHGGRPDARRADAGRAAGRASGDAAGVTLLTAEMRDPGGYGRILRGTGRRGGGDRRTQGRDRRAVVDHRDQRGHLRVRRRHPAHRSQRDRDRQRGEGTAAHRRDLGGPATGRLVGAYLTDDLWETEGINDRVQLARMNAEMNRRIVEGWMRAGVTVVDPASTWIHASVDLERDVTLLPGTSLEGATSVGAGATIGPETTLTDVEVGEGATIVRAHALAQHHRRRGDRRAVRVSAAGNPTRRRRQDRHIRGDQERPDRRRGQGAAPELRRRRGHRGARQHRGRGDLREL